MECMESMARRELDEQFFRGHIERVAATLRIAMAQMRGDAESLERAVADLAALPTMADAARARALQCQLSLSSGELGVVWLLAALATDPQIRAQALMMVGEAEHDPTLDGLQSLVYGSANRDAFNELGSQGTLRRLRLIERADIGAERPEARATWALSRRLMAWLRGDDAIDHGLANIVAFSESACATANLAGADATIETIRAAFSAASPTVTIVSGVNGIGRRSAIAAVSGEVGMLLLEVDSRRLSRDDAAFRRQLKLIARECKLLGRSPLIRNIDALVDGTDASRVDLVGSELVAELEGPVFVTCGPQRPAIRWGRPTVVVEMKPPTSAQRAQLWLRELGQGTQEDGEYLATQYPLAPALIHHAAAAAKARANGKPMQPEDIYQGVRAVLDDRLGDYARRVEVTQTWEDLVLPEDQREAVQYLVARIRQRRTVYEQWGFAAKVGKGLGTSALFSGPPGTGKTMVAALVAKELGLELYQVDMAKVVSKFIGETERNLGALFDAAEAGHAVLLFDEADSLFGKRTEVKSSNDRYANLETNYLLQRLESFTGICLLTSNHEANIDPAFQRRLSLHVRFELPEAEERAALWRAMLPAAAPVQPGMDFERLARSFVMSGGYIRNAALRAAFLAAEEASAITAAHLERAARLEMEAMGRISST